LVIGSAGEEDFAGVEFVEGAAYGPGIDGVVIGDAEDDFGGSVEATY
jgi:hypothetical protein